MEFSFELTEPDGRQSVSPPPSSSTPKAELRWLPLQYHPIFSTATKSAASAAKTPTNLMAWDGASQLHVWDSHKKCLHWLSIRLGDPDRDYISAGFPSKVLQACVPVRFDVSKISISRNGSALLLAGRDGLHVIYLYGRASREENTIICMFTGVELDALRSSIESYNARLTRHLHSEQVDSSNRQKQMAGRRVSRIQDNELSQLKSSLEKLSLINSENGKKVVLVESALSNRVISK